MNKTITLICENAINYNSLDEAKALIQREAEVKDKTGVEILSKFQLFGEEQVVNKDHLEYCKARMLTFKEAEALFNYGADIGQKVFFTPMASKYVDWCEAIGVEYYKVRYYDRFNEDIREAVIKTGKPVFISLDKPQTETLRYIIDNIEIHKLYCVPKYPAKMEDYRGKNMMLYQGYSDHLGTTGLLERAIREGNEYHELHVRIGSGYLEDGWSVSLDDLERVLMEVLNK